MRRNFSSGAPWESKVAYSRAVKVGNIIEVSGTTAVKDGEIVGVNNPYLQAKTCFEIIKQSIEALDGKLSDVVRTKMYVTNIDQWEEFGRAHFEYFKDIHPATTMVEVSALIDKQMLIEVEASAVISD